MTRLENWPTLLADYIESRRPTSFTWGENDCCMFAADGVKAVTGVDLAKGLRRYHTKIGAARILKQCGGVRGVPSHVGLKAQPITMAKRGDPVLITMPEGDTLGLCLGARSAFVTPDGLTFWPTLNCSHSWSLDL